MRLSTYIIASNEETNIGDCIESCLEISDEVIVVHNDCSDNTIKIAESKGAACFENEWSGYREQKAFALSKCSGTWALNLDADERISEKLGINIINFINSVDNEVDIASFNRKSFFLGKWINHGDWYPDEVKRLARNGKAFWSGGSVHEYLASNGRCMKLKGDLLHFSYENLNDLVKKNLLYTDLYLVDKKQVGTPPFFIVSIIFRCFWRFFRCYIIKLGFLDGFPGFVISISSAFCVFLKYCKILLESK